jgi:mono/diheme cytochrome c family protein
MSMRGWLLRPVAWAAWMPLLVTGIATSHAQTVDAPRALQNYTLNCMGCHSPTGAGVAGKIPPLRGSLGYFMHVPEGREFVVRVPGASNSALDDAELAEVVNWLLLRFNRDELPPGFVPYTADEVARLRRPAFAEVAQRRAQLIERLHREGIDGARLRY